MRNTQMEINSVDRISNLPEFVLHDILSNLPIKEAARTSLLSKQWNRIWESFPISNFDQTTFTKIPLFVSPSAEYTQKIDNFLNFTKRSLIRSRHCDLRSNEFSLTLTIIDPKLASKAEECLELALNSGAVKVSVSQLSPFMSRIRDADKVLHETTIVPNPYIKYSSVRELSLLGNSFLSEKSIHDIVHNCPNIHSLDLKILERLRKLEINKLDRLERISIFSTKHLSVDIDAPNLRKFHIRSLCRDVPNFTFIGLTSCRGLKRLSLMSLTIADESFHSLISNFPLLEELSIQSCTMLQRVTISAQRLESLEFYYCKNIEAIEIDAPVLSSFSYRAEILPRLFLKKTPSDMEIDHRLWNIPVDTSRFVNLRKFLATSTVVECLTVTINALEPTFDREELRRFVIPPPRQLQHLKLEINSKRQSEDEATVLEGLFWSCHPKRLSVSWDWGTVPQKGFQKVFCERLITKKKKPLSCCGSSNVKCWRHYLNSATVEGSLGGQEICFNLNWDDSIS